MRKEKKSDQKNMKW